MIRIGAALVFAVLASAALGQTPPASQSEAETPKAPPTVYNEQITLTYVPARDNQHRIPVGLRNWVLPQPAELRQRCGTHTFRKIGA
jgi:hypothetical protein